MHFCVGVIVEDYSLDIDYILDKFHCDNEDYQEFDIEISKEDYKNEALRIFEYEKKYAGVDEALTKLNRIKRQLDAKQYYDIILQSENYQDVDDKGNFGNYYNPYGICDWCSIGGRFSGYLNDGNDDECIYSIKEYKEHIIKKGKDTRLPYGIITADEEYVDKDQADIKELILGEDDNYYIVIVDMHI